MLHHPSPRKQKGGRASRRAGRHEVVTRTASRVGCRRCGSSGTAARRVSTSPPGSSCPPRPSATAPTTRLGRKGHGSTRSRAGQGSSRQSPLLTLGSKALTSDERASKGVHWLRGASQGTPPDAGAAAWPDAWAAHRDPGCLLSPAVGTEKRSGKGKRSSACSLSFAACRHTRLALFRSPASLLKLMAGR